MSITATHINYYHICHRKLWLFANGITMEHSSVIVAEGKQLHETSYIQRSDKYTEMNIGGSVIDYYDAKNKVVHEVKKSNKVEMAHEWQVKYYILLLEQNGIEGATGILEYPKLRETKTVVLLERDKAYLLKICTEITAMIADDNCPEVINAKICKSCSYYEFCYITESEID
jgi:CRISPR-associated exonuclease Cas4